MKWLIIFFILAGACSALDDNWYDESQPSLSNDMPIPKHVHIEMPERLHGDYTLVEQHDNWALFNYDGSDRNFWINWDAVVAYRDLDKDENVELGLPFGILGLLGLIGAALYLHKR